MQVNPADVVSLPAAQASASVTVRVISGNFTGVPLGSLLQAVVAQVNPREATLDVNGQQVTVRPSAGLQVGAALLLRVPNSGTNTLEISSAPRAPKAETQTVPTGSTQVKVVDVVATLPDGRVQVRIDGKEQTATVREPLTPSQEPLAPGQRLILEVTQGPTGPVLRPPPESAALPTQVATALLRSAPPPDLAAALKPLQAELTALVAPPTGKGEAPLPAAVREAAVAVRDTVRALVPNEPRAPSATDLQNLVENGGIHFEAKLARLANDAPAGDTPQPQVATELKGDLKGDLLRLLQTTRELGVAVQLPAARATLEGIEAQQATQTLAQATGTPYVLQVPFPDRDAWRTLHLSIEREEQSAGEEAEYDGDELRGRFRMLMHVPLTDLGDTWIDAGMSGGSFRAAIYLDRPADRERVKAALPELNAELRTDGFREVLLDVRSTGDLPAKARQQSAAMIAGHPASTSLLDVRA